MKITILMLFLMLGSFLAGMELADTLNLYEQCKRMYTTPEEELADTLNPYEQCKRMYTTPEDIGECVWIKENP